MSGARISLIGRQAVSSLRAEPVAGPSVISRRYMESAANNHPRGPSSYPFSKKVCFPPSITAKPVAPRLTSPPSGAVIIDHITAAERSLRDPENLGQTIFKPKGSQRLHNGSILAVTTWTNMDRTATTTFSGVLMAQRRPQHAVAQSFRLRNIVNKLGIEVNYKLHSPLIKEIKVIKRALRGHKKDVGGMKAIRHSKAYYLRERPDLMKNLAGVLKQEGAQQRKQAREAAEKR